MLPPSSLVVCTRDRPEFVRALIDSVLRGEEVPTEIIVVDQSDEPDLRLAERATDRCAIVHVPSDSRGLSAARNAAIRLIRAPVVVLTDDDTIATPTWYGTLVSRLLSEGSRAVITGQVLPTTPEVAGGFAPSVKTDAEEAVYVGRLNQDVLYPNNMALLRETFEEVGRFDERLGAGTHYPGAEDNDFCYRLLDLGYRIVYEPRAALYHRAWRQPGDFLRHQWSYARGQGGFYGKHLSLRDRHMLGRLVADVAARCRHVAWNAVREPRAAAGDAVFVAGLLSAAIEWVVVERVVRSRLRTPT
jgi:GT2 family glycosyltransferase